MIIDQLPEISAVQETDEIPVERGTATYKTTLQKLKNLVASLLTKSDVGLGNVDNVRQYSAENPPPYLGAYPVGSIYVSVNSANPGTLFGGTWERIQNCFLLAAGSTYTAGSTGGEATHTLTVDEMPSHKHGLTECPMKAGQAGTGTDNFGTVQMNSVWASDYRTDATGGGQAHNNMPPYLAVYMWKRTA